MPHFSTGPLAVVVIFILIVILLISGRTLIRVLFRPLQRALSAFGRRFVAPVYRVTLGPIVWAVRRASRIILGFAEAGQPARPIQLGTAPYKALLHLIDMNSMSETELGEVPRSIKSLVDRKGRFFRSVNANKAVEGVHESLSLEEARNNIESAKNFYGKSIEHGINPTILYEDSEEALIIGILRDLDVRFFYVMRRIKRNVSRNVVKVLMAMTAVVIVSPFVISYFVAQLVPRLSAVPYSQSDARFYGVLYAGACVVLALLLIMLRYTYSNSARYNGQQFNYFAQTYFSRLLNQYKSAAAAFSNVLNDRTARLDAVEDNANLWFLNMHWLSARQWLLELFVRNMTFQIGRNWFWSIIAIPPLLFAIALGLYFILSNLADGIVRYVNSALAVNYPMTDFSALRSEWTLAPSAVLFIIYIFALTELLKKFWYEITPGGWLGFRTMDIKEAIEHNVGPIAREVVDKRRNPYGQQQQPLPPGPTQN